MKICSGIKSILSVMCCAYAVSAFAADTLNGKVLNQTTNQPAAGDEVVLLRLENGMEEEAKTRTDAQGAFALQLTVANAKHIVRVLHRGVNYDLNVTGKGPLEIPVFDAVPHIQNLQGSIGIAQVESDGQMLKITEMYSITNDSVPPVTQSGPRNFEISIPPKATLDSTTVKKGGGIWVNVTPTPVKGQQGRYAIDFPIRPGDTLFKFIYHLPYAGPTTLHVKLAYPIKSFAVMHPPSMSFKSSQPKAFTSPGEAQGLRVEQAVSKPVVRDVPAFEISGTGLAPAKASQSSPATSPAAAAAARNPATAVAVTPPAAAGQPENGVWIILTGIGALLGATAYAVWKRRKRTT
ncbi:MAG: hypothetical protein LAO78_02750 [Acidobacteriia bacterium]|nr:hypothetical protein [Terriglobia bacterium]